MKNLCGTGDVDLKFSTPIPINDSTEIMPYGNKSAIDKVEVTKISGIEGNIKQMNSYFPRVKEKHVAINQLFWTYQKTKTTINTIMIM